MEYTFEDRIKHIFDMCLESESTDPIDIFIEIASSDYIRIHGPEHHILDGACLLTAFYNAGGNIDLKESLHMLCERGKNMPGAMCGFWGVCGAVTSIGAALSIIEKTGPLSTDTTWELHMFCAADTLNSIAHIGGPRCCKRDAFIAIGKAVDYLNKEHNVCIEKREVKCCFSSENSECLKAKCPFYGG